MSRENKPRPVGAVVDITARIKDRSDANVNLASSEQELSIWLLAAQWRVLVEALDTQEELSSTLLELQSPLDSLKAFLRRVRQRPGAAWPDLLRHRLECIQAGDGEPAAFNLLVDRYYAGDFSYALALLSSLRDLHRDLRGAVPDAHTAEEAGDWSADARAQAVAWLRCMEHAEEVSMALDIHTMRLGTDRENWS